jgi:hypothetical protein
LSRLCLKLFDHSFRLIAIQGDRQLSEGFHGFI